MTPHRLFPSLKLIAVVFLSNLVHSMLQEVDLSDDCLSCICQATTGCNISAGCTGDVCGPYWITKPYWEDAGKPTTLNDAPDDNGAFERCADDSICSAQTVRGYMYKFRQDCNGDAVITCLDYAKIHRQGAYGCYGPLDDPFKSKLEPCLKDVGEWYSAIDRTANQQHTEISDSLLYEGVTDGCLACLCKVSSDCNISVPCVGDLCGPYRMTRTFWLHGNMQTVPLDSPTRPGAFIRCASDPICAGQTIKSYMHKYRRDCNGDGKVTCLDYVKIYEIGVSRWMLDMKQEYILA